MKISVEVAFSVEQLGDQYCTACRAAEGVVGKSHELVIKDGVLAQTSDGNAHTAFQIAVEVRLRTVLLLKVGEDCSDILMLTFCFTLLWMLSLVLRHLEI